MHEQKHLINLSSRLARRAVFARFCWHSLDLESRLLRKP
ncbi:hypothetical protein SynSYN20_02299 [Synechococcus sp. SYN20]|nr:hypothetical protein SynMVIR181_02013 [Synechococcus sp. MVIR-18-1]QNJ26621.1 hypothetical protein SynSYN20_02299 [Synechococcus sp. SYN20]